MKKELYSIPLSSELSNLVEDALAIVGKVEFTKENQTMEIKIKGKLILHFDQTISDNRIIEVELSE